MKLEELLYRRQKLFKLLAIVIVVVGILFTAIGFEVDAPLVVVLNFFFTMASFICLERFDTYIIRREYRELSSKLLNRLDRIDTYLKASEPDKLTVALFDHLLIYLPLYVADFSGYLKEENIELEKYEAKGSDNAVAKMVCSNEADIGLCDPCMCARKEFRRNGDELSILVPLIIKGAAYPVTKREGTVRSKLLKGGEISIATYGFPSTTFVMAASLKEQLENKSNGKSLSELKVNLISKNMKDFDSENYKNLLDQHELVMLWEPFLTIAKETSAEVEYFELDQDVSKVLPDVMYSAIVISNRLLSEKPTLGIRLFRAISRAMQKIQLASDSETFCLEVLKAAADRINFPTGFDAKKVIQKMILSGMFPLIENPNSNYTQTAWKNQLFAAIQYRQAAIQAYPTELNEDLVEDISRERCLKFFCDKEVFEPRKLSLV